MKKTAPFTDKVAILSMLTREISETFLGVVKINVFFLFAQFWGLFMDDVMNITQLFSSINISLSSSLNNSNCVLIKRL